MDLCEKFYGLSQAYFDEKSCGHTAREIAHQPDMWLDLCKILEKNKNAIKDFMAKIGPLKDIRIILTGAGSSGFVGSMVSSFAAISGGLRSEAIHTTDIVSAPDAYFSKDCDKPTLLISFARSGNSPESDGAVHVARKLVKNLYEVAIVCGGDSKLYKTTLESDKSLVLVMPKGTNDKAFAMTSSVSTMTLAGFALLNPDKTDEIISDITNLAALVEKNGPIMYKAATDCTAWDFERTWYLGSGPLAHLAKEAALKMMELSNGAVVAGSNSSAEFRHGPKTVVCPKALTVHFISNNSFTAKYDMDLLNELCREREGNKVVALNVKPLEGPDLTITYNSEKFGIGADIAVGMQGLVFMQMLSMNKSIALGLPTDNPSPKGLVNRVVQGVTVYPI